MSKVTVLVHIEICQSEIFRTNSVVLHVWFGDIDLSSEVGKELI